MAVPNNPLFILLLGMFLSLLGSLTPAWTNTLHLTLQLWSILHPILVRIILHVGDDKGLAISHIGHNTLHSSKRIFKLSNVLHVFYITKPLFSIQNFCRDNHVYFKFHASVFYVKDIITNEVLLSNQSSDSLYVLSKSSATSIPQACWSPCISVTADMWLHRLGHPTSCILNLLLSKNKLICTSKCSLTQCQACLLGKSLRLS